MNPNSRRLSMKRSYVPKRTRARSSAPRVVSGRAAFGRFVSILDEDPYTEGSELADGADADTEADALPLLTYGARRWH